MKRQAEQTLPELDGNRKGLRLGLRMLFDKRTALPHRWVGDARADGVVISQYGAQLVTLLTRPALGNQEPKAPRC